MFRFWRLKRVLADIKEAAKNFDGYGYLYPGVDTARLNLSDIPKVIKLMPNWTISLNDNNRNPMILVFGDSVLAAWRGIALTYVSLEKGGDTTVSMRRAVFEFKDRYYDYNYNEGIALPPFDETMTHVAAKLVSFEAKRNAQCQNLKTKPSSIF